MFRGINTVSIDNKGRLAIPSCYREQLMAEADGRLVTTISPLDRSLWIYPLPEWEIIDAKLADLSDFDKQGRRAKQMMRGYAKDQILDGQGRISLSQETRDYAQLEKQIVILGQGNKFEAWAQNNWEEQRDQWLAEVADESSEPSAALQSISL